MSRTINAPEFARNYGFWGEDVQQGILDTSVAIGGVGGDGYHLGLRLANMGVSTFDVADPEVFEPENANRVPGATTATYGRSKAEVFREDVLKINPEADVRIFTEGVTAENAEEFVSRADMVFDETELTYLHIGTAVARAARERGIPDILVMNVGFAAQVTSFDPESKHTFERMMGIPKDMPLDEIRETQTLDLANCVPYIPKYADLNTLKAVQEGAPLPSIAAGVDVAASLGQTEALKHIAHKVDPRWEKPVMAPRIRYQDALTGESGIAHLPKVSYYRRAITMALRSSVLKVNPQASYTQADRDRRAAAYRLEQQAFGQ